MARPATPPTATTVEASATSARIEEVVDDLVQELELPTRRPEVTNIQVK
jgi:hypothetical protein